MYERFEPSEQIFVNREDHLDWMSEALKRCKDKAVVLQLYGIGGIGKSSLLDHWNRTIDSTIRLDCKQYSDFYSRLNVLAKGAVILGLKLPRFDVLWQIRLRFVEGLEPVKEEGREWAKEVLTAIPFIGSLANIGGAIGAISAKVTPKLKGRYGDLAAWLQRHLGRNHIEKLLEILWKDPSHAQILFMDALLEDLNSRKQMEPILFLLDHFEQIDSEDRNWKYTGKKISESELWCVFLSSLKNCVGVVATRQSIPSSQEESDIEYAELAELNRESCVELLEKRSVEDTELQDRIVSVSGGNPFVIDAICDMIETSDVSLEDVDCLRASTLEEVRLKTWRRLFSYAEGLHDLVNRAGLLPSVSKEVMNIITPSITSDQWNRLLQLSFVRALDDGEYALHELAKELIITELGNRLTGVVEEVASLLEAESERTSDMPLLGRAISVRSLASSEDAISRLRKIADDLLGDGLIIEAAKLLESAVLESAMGRTTIRGLKGKLLEISQRYSEAELELQSAIDLLRVPGKEMGDEAKDFMADCLISLGWTLRNLLDYDGAEKSLQESIELRKELVANAPKKFKLGLVWSLLRWAGYLTYRRPTEAESIILEALDLINQMDDVKSKVSMRAKRQVYNLLGTTHGNMFRWSEEEDAIRKSLRIQQELLDLNPDAPAELRFLALLYNNLGATLQIQGQEAESGKLLKQSLHFRKMGVKLQADSQKSQLLILLNNLGFHFLRVQKPLIAEKYFQEAHSILEELPLDIPSIWLGILGYTLSGLAYVSLEKDEIDESLALISKAVNVRRDLMKNAPASFGQGVGFALNVAGIIFSRAEQESLAEESFLEAIERLDQVKMQPLWIPLYLASCLNNYGVLLMRLGRDAEASEKLTESVQILRNYMKSAPQLHPGWVAEILTNYAISLKRNDILKDSEKILEEALSLEDRLKDTAPELYLYHRIHTLYVYSSLLKQQGNEKKAKAFLEESLDPTSRFSEMGLSSSELAKGSEDEGRFLIIF